MKALYTFFENHLDSIIGIPAMIASLITLKKYVFKKKKKMTMELPRLPYECIGREEEKKEIKKRILSGKSMFIYGAVGVGKKTVINYSIQEAKKDLEKKMFDKVFWYNVSEGDSFEHICNELSLKIDDSGLKRFEDLLSRGKYLIWLYGCENINCLHDLLNISNNPVFIFASVKMEQGNSLLPFVGADNILQITTLSLKDGEKLLSGKLNIRKLLDNKRRQINKQIVKETNGLPLLIYLTKRNYLYKKDPEAYCQELRTKGLEVISDEYKCKDLLKSAFGLDVNTQSERLSLDAQKALGFLGCMSEDGFFCSEKVFDIFSKKVKRELLKTHLIEIHDEIIVYKHPLVHTVLRENADKLLDGNYALLHDFIEKVKLIYNMGGKYDIGSLSNVIFHFKNHLLDAIKYVITNDLISNFDEEKLVCCGLYILGDFGFYEDVLLLEKLFTPINNISDISPILNDVKQNAYIGLEKYEKCSVFLAQYESTISDGCNHDEILRAFNNSIYIYYKFKQYKDAIHKSMEFIKYLESHNLKDDIKYNKDIITIIELVREVLYWSKTIDDMKAFLDSQIDLIREMKTLFDKEDFILIDAELIIAFSLEELEFHEDAVCLFTGIFSSINSTCSFRDPHAIGIIEDIGRFFHNLGNYNQANELYKEILPYSERVFGNKHVITERIRANYEENKAKMETDEIDESKVLMHISANPRKKNLRTFINNLINKVILRNVTPQSQILKLLQS